MEKKIKVLHVLWSGGIGGTEEYITSLVRYFDRSIFNVHICFLSKKGEIYEEALKISNLTVSYMGITNGFDIINSIRFAQYLLREKFDIVHCHSSNILSNITISLFRKPRKIFTEHVSPGAMDAFQKRKLFYRLFSNSFQVIVAISEFVKQKIGESMTVNPDKIQVIHNGIQTTKYNNTLSAPQVLLHIKKNNKYTFGFIGRMVDFKRPLLFIEIAAEIIKRKKDMYFIMVGDGPELEKCRETVNHYNMNEYFNFLGFRRDIPNILKLFDALLFTSKGEGFGIVLLEAMAMGVPVFAVNDGAVSEIIEHGKSGILLDTLDPQVIAQKILDIAEDKKLINNIKNQCIEDARLKFSIERCVKQLEDVYRKVLSAV